jgi:hypothetical protein
MSGAIKDSILNRPKLNVLISRDTFFAQDQERSCHLAGSFVALFLRST